ncbi:hypothetical protein [Salinibacterium sp. ZJ450]|uniref:hypothetical protein n=1 Tax=Salinibacterium sp. ZJ450 TaxID=2708338 RepID=UPI00141E83B1|nr:hypothetical protein [Salinibacterium sp. ZJ450]
MAQNVRMQNVAEQPTEKLEIHLRKLAYPRRALDHVEGASVWFIGLFVAIVLAPWILPALNSNLQFGPGWLIYWVPLTVCAALIPMGIVGGKIADVREDKELAAAIGAELERRTSISN